MDDIPDKLQMFLHNLVNSGHIIAYPPLYIEANEKNVVAHWEHTILITPNGVDNIILSGDPFI